MACWYISENIPNMTNLKTLCNALDKMGHKYQVHQVGNAAVIESRDFRIELTPQGTQVDRADGNRTWVNQLKQRYAVEAAKAKAKKKGYFVKEQKVGNKIELSLRR